MANVLENAISSVGNLVTGGAQKRAAEAQERALAQMQGLELPDMEQMKVYIQDLVSQGKITPEEAQTYLQENTELQGISTDPVTRQAQLDALSGLQKISSEGGLTAQDQAKLNQIRTQEDTQARGQREAILQNAQARGVGGSGVELMSQMLNQQQSAQNQSQRDLDVGALAEQRALEALIAGGQLGGQMQETEFGQKAQVANAQDAINRFNAANRQSVANTNVGARNTAQYANLQNAQDIANTNAANRNQAEYYNKNLPQQGFENAYRKAGGTAGAYNNIASQAAAAGQNNQKVLGSLVSAGAVGAAGGGAPQMVAAGQGYNEYNKPAQTGSDVRMKEDVSEFDPSEFLDSVTSYKYHYKKPEMGSGENYGVMAQDLEKTKEGAAMVEDTPEGKKVDYGKGFSTLMAAMADMHQRVKELEGSR